MGDVFERYTHDVELDSGCVLFALGEGAQRPIPFGNSWNSKIGVRTLRHQMCEVSIVGRSAGLYRLVGEVGDP